MSTTDAEQFCPRCRAGVESAEHHEKCVRTGHAEDGEAARTPAPGTERDERLRRIQEKSARAAVYYPDTRDDDTAFLLEQVARLDAVVTAVREVHRYRYLAGDAYPTCDGCGYIADDEDDPCPTRRALDGGAS